MNSGSKIVILPHSSLWAFVLAGFAGLITWPRTTNVMGTMVAMKYTLLYAMSVSCRLSTCNKRAKKNINLIIILVGLFCNQFFSWSHIWKTYYETDAGAVKNHKCIQEVHEHKHILSVSHFWRNRLLPPVNDCSKT